MTDHLVLSHTIQNPKVYIIYHNTPLMQEQQTFHNTHGYGRVPSGLFCKNTSTEMIVPVVHVLTVWTDGQGDEPSLVLPGHMYLISYDFMLRF